MLMSLFFTVTFLGVSLSLMICLPNFFFLSFVYLESIYEARTHALIELRHSAGQTKDSLVTIILVMQCNKQTVAMAYLLSFLYSEFRPPRRRKKLNSKFYPKISIYVYIL